MHVSEGYSEELSFRFVIIENDLFFPLKHIEDCNTYLQRYTRLFNKIFYQYEDYLLIVSNLRTLLYMYVSLCI